MPGTRFYQAFEIMSPQAGLPAFDISWDSNAGSNGRFPAPTNSTLWEAEINNITSPVVSNTKRAFWQCITDPLSKSVNFGALTFSFVLQGAKNGSGSIAGLMMVGVRLWHTDGSVDSLLPLTACGSGLNSALEARILSAVSLAHITSKVGDRIVVEVGVQNTGPSASFILRPGISNAGDLNLASGSQSTTNQPWFSFDGIVLPVSKLTRFYLPSAGAAAAAPSFDPSWDDTSSFSPDRIAAVTAKSNTAISPKSSSSFPPNTAVKNCIARQYVTAPIGAGVDFTNVAVTAETIGTGTARGSSPYNANFMLSVRLYHQNGSFDTLLALTQGDAAYTEASTTCDAKLLYGSLSSVVSQDGDRIVIEIGVHISTGVSTTITASPKFGDPASSPADMLFGWGFAQFNNGVPWVEFDTEIFVKKRTFTGGLSFSGGFLIKPSHLYFAAALNFVGGMGGFFSELALSASLAFSAMFNRRLPQVFRAQLITLFSHPSHGPARAIACGFLTKLVLPIARTATLSFSGFFNAVHQFNKLLSAALSFVGTMGGRAFSRIFRATLNFVTLMGALHGGVTQYFQDLIASMALPAAIQRFIANNQSATLAPTSTSQTTINAERDATLNFSGAITRAIATARAGVLSLQGAITRTKGKFFLATLNFASTIPRAINSIQATTLGLIGFLPKFTATGIFNAILSFIGVRVENLQLVVQGAVIMELTVQGATQMEITVKEK